MTSISHCMTITLFFILFLIQTMSAFPLFPNNKQSIQQQVFETNDNIIIIIPKPNIDQHSSKYHTMSCFQDITEEEELEEEIQDLLYLLEDNNISDDYEEQEEDGHYHEQQTDLLEPLKNMMKSLFYSSTWWWPSSTTNDIWDKINGLLKQEKREADQFQFYFDA